MPIPIVEEQELKELPYRVEKGDWKCIPLTFSGRSLLLSLCWNAITHFSMSLSLILTDYYLLTLLYCYHQAYFSFEEWNIATVMSCLFTR